MQRDKADKLSLPSQEQLIASLIQVRNKFEALQKALEQDRELAEEYAIHSNAKSLSAKDFTPVFKARIIKPYHNLVKEYLNLKKDIQRFIASDELDDIENSVLNVVNDDEKRKKLYYFPTYQKIHESAFNKHQEQVKSQISTIESKVEKIKFNYEARRKVYKEIYFGAGLASIVLLGLPVLIGTAIVQLIDKIILEIRKKSLCSDIASKKVNLNEQRHPQRKSMHEKIRNDSAMRLRQGLFFVVQTRHQPSLKALDNIDAVNRLATSTTPG